MMNKRLFSALILGLFSSALFAQTQPFDVGSVTTTIAATTTSANDFVAGSTSALRVYNSTTCAARMKMGNSNAVIASIADVPVAPGAVEIFSIPPNYGYVAIMMESCTGNVFLTRGTGL